MAEVGKKRKLTRSLEGPIKRLCIRTQSTSDAGLFNYYQGESEAESDNDLEGDSDGYHSQNADTPLTPFSPPRKFPSDLKTIKCTHEGCTKSFNRPARLAAHLRSHSNERPFVCSYVGCDKSYIEEKHLKQHIKGSHTHEKSYQCDWDGCSKSFLTATRLRRHREAHEGHDRFRCTSYPPCNQTFRKHQTLQRHIRADHLAIAPFPCTFVDPATQVACNAGFDSSGALKKHEDRVHGTHRFWCDECSAVGTSQEQDISQQIGFRTKTELAKHIRNEHSNCIFCDLKCGSQLELERHLETQHSSNGAEDPNSRLAERKTIKCPFSGCPKAFTKKYNLDVHIRSTHNGQRFTCSASSISNNVKSPELALWTGINACGKDFASKANLEDHIRTQHLGLPSVINAKRPKSQNSGKKKNKKTASQENDNANAINLLTGAGYAQDPARNIHCLVPNCQWLFTRQYDLTLHLQSAHGLSPSDIADGTVEPRRSFDDTQDHDPGDRTALEAMYDEADLEWEMRHTAVATATANSVDGEDEEDEEEVIASSQFWIGASRANSNVTDDPFGEPFGEEGVGDDYVWEREREEMRRLCNEGDDDDQNRERDDVLLDPDLMGL